uniref:Uncharacterized protein n=1 Tax=Bartonella rochalimae ATCC BAA-1498 TaxID=685782 RepID=E6YMS1_9HYPH|nr:hypothetical protein BARRO_80023 [Bartonella rochalimae ATCC BAA-1498]
MVNTILYLKLTKTASDKPIKIDNILHFKICSTKPNFFNLC